MSVNQDWLAGVRIPPDRPAWSLFDELRRDARLRVDEILAGLALRQDLSEDLKKMSILYDSFMAENVVEERGLDPLRPIFRRIDAIKSIRDLARHFGWSLRHGFGSLFRVDQDVDPGNPDRYVLFLTQSGLGLPDSKYYLDERYSDKVVKYQEYMQSVMTLIFGKEAAGAAPSVLSLEAQIATCHWSRTQRRDLSAMYFPQRWSEFRKTNNFPWEAFRKGARLDTRALATFVNAQRTFPSDASKLVTSNALGVWRWWAKWMVVLRLSPFLGSRVREPYYDFFGGEVLGTKSTHDRKHLAADFVEDVMGEAVGREYVAKCFPKSSRTRALGLVKQLVGGYQAMIMNCTWMGSDARDEAVRKLDNLVVLVGHPDVWRNYRDLRVKRDRLVENALSASVFAWDYAMRQINKPVDRYQWPTYPQSPNASYHPVRNRIVIPAAVLQSPLFDGHLTLGEAFGGIGAVIAHEIGHAFDDQGSKTDHTGRLRDWWTDSERARFDEIVESLVSQYDGLACGNRNDRVDGRLTVGENLADLSGLEVALYALKTVKCDTRAQRELLLRDFFTGWARTWRIKTRVDAELHANAVDRHAPGEVRCNQCARNLDEFHRLFKTEPGDRMWLDEGARVHLWQSQDADFA